MSQEEEFIDVNQALTLRESMDGWYCIEKKEHENEMGFRPFGPPGLGGMALYSSARPSDADVEGTAEEMLDIAQAIDERGSFSAKRCAVRVEGDFAYFCSPRNSMQDARVPFHHARDLAVEIKAKLS
jgi:hypothetical protein